MTLSAGTNILLDPLLINGGLGFPRLELQGAALATVIARAVSLVAALLVLRFKEKLLSPQIPTLQETLWCWRDILVVGLPAATASMLIPISHWCDHQLLSFLWSRGGSRIWFSFAGRVVGSDCHDGAGPLAWDLLWGKTGEPDTLTGCSWPSVRAIAFACSGDS